METIEYTRQLDWFNPHDNKSVSVAMVGCGGVGSFSAIAMSKLGIPHLSLIDDDEVEAHNIPNQFYELDQIGSKKVEALAALCERFGNTDCDTIDGRVGDGALVPASGIVVSGLDSMESRAEVWKQVKYKSYCPLYIDVRLGGQMVVIYCIDPCNTEDIKQYENTLHSDDESVSQSCTARGIIDVGFVVGSMVTRLVRQQLTNYPIQKMHILNQETFTTQSSDWIEEL